MAGWHDPEIKWTHSLGLSPTFMIELDRNNDGACEELIAAAAPAQTPTIGTFAWIVTGPPSGAARVRVSWTGNPVVSDSSDVGGVRRRAAASVTSRPRPWS